MSEIQTVVTVVSFYAPIALFAVLAARWLCRAVVISGRGSFMTMSDRKCIVNVLKARQKRLKIALKAAREQANVEKFQHLLSKRPNHFSSAFEVEAVFDRALRIIEGDPNPLRRKMRSDIAAGGSLAAV